MTRPRVIGTLLAALFLPGCIHNSEKAKRNYLQRGEQLFKSGHYADAEIQFRKSLQQDPRFGDAYLDLGRTEVKLGNYSLALSTLRQASVLMPGQDAPKIELGDFLLVSYLANPNRPAEGYKQISEIADGLLRKNPNSFEGVRFKGYLEASGGDPAKAVEYFENANRLRPGQADIVTALCGSLVRTGNTQKAEEMAREFLLNKPGYGPLSAMLYQLYMAKGQTAQAEAVLRQKIAASPKEASYRIELARHYARIGNTAMESSVLEQILSDSANFPHVWLAVGDFYMDSRRWAEARRYYTQGAETDRPMRTMYWKRLVRTEMAMNDVPAARNTLDQILKEEPDDAEAHSSRAALRMAEKDPAERKLAIAELESLVARAPQSTEYRLQYADSLYAVGQNDGAKEQYRAVAQRQPKNPAALRALAEFSIREQRFDDALGYADRILALQPGEPAATLVRSAALAGKGRFAETRLVLNGLTKQHPEVREAQLQLALLDVEEKHYAQAEARFRKYYAPGKGDVKALEGLVEVYRAQDRLDKVVPILQDDLKQRPQDDGVRALLAKTAADAGIRDVAVNQYEQLARSQPDSVSIAIQFGLALQTKGDLAGAIGQFERATKLAPRNALAYAFLATALDQAGRRNEAIASNQKSLALDDRNPWVMNNLAFLLADANGDLNAALKLAQSAVKAVPASTAFRDTLGYVYLRRKEFQTAVHTFEAVTDEEPKDAGFRTHLGQALLASGNAKEARSELTAALALSTASAQREAINAILRQIPQQN